jgi:hypothetical protein
MLCTVRALIYNYELPTSNSNGRLYCTTSPTTYYKRQTSNLLLLLPQCDVVGWK